MNATVAEYHGSGRPDSHGISVVFFDLPDAKDLTYDANYRDYDSGQNIGNGGEFINTYRWDEFLEAYYTYAGLQH